VNFVCPVCGFNELIEKPYDGEGGASYEICPCSRFEYGFTDYKVVTLLRHGEKTGLVRVCRGGE